MNAVPARWGGSHTSTILVVDDDAVNRALLHAWLGGAYRVLEAEDGAAGLLRVERDHPDLVILDVSLPGWSGIDVCRRIKGGSEGEFLPVLLLSAYNDQPTRHRALQAGADDFLTKPVDRQELLLRVRALAHLRRQEQLIHQQVVQLRRMDALKDDLVSLVSHDLMNALSGIHVLVQTMSVTDQGPELALLRQSVDRMRDMLSDMLRVAQLEDGVLTVEHTWVRAMEMVHGAFALVAPGAAARHVRLRMDVPVDARVCVDPSLFQRALFNLLQNAVKYSPRGAEVVVSVAISPGTMTFDVLDRGPGVSDEVRAHLFDKYSGVTTRQERGRTGHGLGLYLVQLVAAAHGGEITAVARPEGGTSFRLVLPQPVAE